MVEAWDGSAASLAIARENNKELGTSVVFRRHDLFTDPPEPTAIYDVIVSNPPYVRESERNAMERNVLDWEPAEALFVPDDDPLRYYRRITKLGRSLLKVGGKLFFEINCAYSCETVDLLEKFSYKDVSIYKDLSGKDRFVTAIK